ncbi:MAG: carbohydrate-binding domain-containing protein [Candidatus Ancillula sp.]|jgi:hypothetical protein|nr:carbohydrate-binding domain-containing protein [Candidatus Ancillula sp.]
MKIKPQIIALISFFIVIIVVLVVMIISQNSNTTSNNTQVEKMVNGRSQSGDMGGPSKNTVATKVDDIEIPAISSTDELKNAVLNAKTWEYNLKDKHLDSSVDENNAIKVDVSGKSGYTITDSGTYIFTGQNDNFQLVVNAGKKDDVRVVLNNVHLAKSNAPVIDVKAADHLTLILPANTSSYLGDTLHTIADSDPNGVIYSESDLILVGMGKLDVISTSGHAIRSKGDIFLNANEVSVNSAGSGIKSSDGLYVLGGSYAISAANDGVRANDDLVVLDGKVDITKSNEGIESSRINLLGGEINVVASDDGINASQKVTDEENTTTENREAAQPGVWIYIAGSKLTVKANADGVDSNGHLLVTGGDISITCADRGGDGPIDANGYVLNEGGNFTINGEQKASIEQYLESSGEPNGGFGNQQPNFENNPQAKNQSRTK